MDIKSVKSDDETLASLERQTPAWEIRCLRCGMREPWEKYGIRKFAAGRKYTVGHCSRCGRFCCHVITKLDGSVALAQRA
ncbi:MAG TPA: hypothetical protein PKK48_02435 [Phycisphaerae bacterium]|nr:hypothetical protein [Phycisphaerae bacterium]